MCSHAARSLATATLYGWSATRKLARRNVLRETRPDLYRQVGKAPANPGGEVNRCAFIDPNPVTFPRKPSHGLRDCALPNFRVAPHAGAILQSKFKLSKYPTKSYQSGQAEDSYWKLPTEGRTLIQELLVSGQISKGDFFQLSRLGLCLFGLFQVQPHVGKELY
jgi:hypothetical protein